MGIQNTCFGCSPEFSSYLIQIHQNAYGADAECSGAAVNDTLVEPDLIYSERVDGTKLVLLLISVLGFVSHHLLHVLRVICSTFNPSNNKYHRT